MIAMHWGWLAVLLIGATAIGFLLCAFLVGTDDPRDHTLTRDSDPFSEPWQ